MRWALAVAASAGAVLTHVAPGVTWLPPVRRVCAPSLAGRGRPGHLALTFDDGPDAEGTPAVLAELDRLGWQATFFLLGSMVRRHPRVAQQIAAAGHELAIHGDVHHYLLARTPWAVADDLSRAVDAVGSITGRAPTWYRPPYGVLTTTGLLEARRHRLRPVLWSAWGRDWRADATPSSVVGTLVRGRLSGGTALLHDSDVTSAPGSWRATVAALPLLADALQARSLTPGPLRDHGVVGRC